MGAVSLANEEIEKIRNLGYENLSSGAAENVEMTKNGISYYVTTNINDFDDAQDGSIPEDSVSWDYKKINIKVNWILNDESKKIELNAIVVPPVREEDASKGYLRLHIIDQNGNGLPSASLSIRDLTDNELIYSGSANSSGDLFLTGLDPGLHKITIGDANNYYPVETLDETGIFDPSDGHAEIVEKTLTEKNIQTDKVSVLNVSLKDTFGNIVANLGFDISGGKFLGTENGTTAIYGFSDTISGSDGTESFSDMSFGPYFFSFTDLNDESNSVQYQFLWLNPISDLENKISLNANETLEAEAILASEVEHSLLVEVADSITAAPIADASVKVQLASDPLLYDVTLTTNAFGKAYFPETPSTMTNSNYNISISASGYNDLNDTADVSGFTNKSILLTESI